MELSDDLTVIITAPHAYCLPDLVDRHCDRRALDAADSLFLMVTHQTVIFRGNILRYHVDLNRSESRSTPFRQELSSVISTVSGGLLVDVHSFPSSKFNDVDVAVLDNAPGTNYGKTLAFLLMYANPWSSYLRGSLKNDIVEEGRSKGLDSILIEYNERLTLDEIERINRVVNYFIDIEIDRQTREKQIQNHV